jgi:hypothetical protein
VENRVRLAVLFLAAGALAAVSSDSASARRKIELIQSDRLKPGSRVELTTRELDAYVADQLPAGVRNPRLNVVTPGTATGSALVDFGKLRRSLGYDSGWLMSRLLDGERPVSVTARIESSGGRAKVDVRRVEISGLELDGATLDFLIRNVLLPLYPDAAVSRPFDLGYRIERLDVQPRGVGVVIGP